MSKSNIIGRNDPCPCGSGKKYKHCCLDKQTKPGGVSEELAPALEEAQAFAEQLIMQKNQQNNDDFQGLSPEQMHCFLYFPFESPQHVQFKEPQTEVTNSPIWWLFRLMTDAMGAKGLKSTVKGNLPQKFCREAAALYATNVRSEKSFVMRGINKENDFYDLHITRLIAEMAGLIHKPKNHFMLSDDCQQLLQAENYGAIYLQLFKTYVREFNWAYCDNYPDLEIIQHSFAFSLYLLSRYGNESRHQNFYEEAFLTAFPMAVDMVEASNFFSPEVQIRGCYTLRTMHSFGKFLGLVSLTALKSDNPYYLSNYEIKKLPLFDELVRFVNTYHMNFKMTTH